MELRVLAVGDVVGEGGLQCLEQHLRSLKKLYRIDFCVVNGENFLNSTIFISSIKFIHRTGNTLCHDTGNRFAGSLIGIPQCIV